MGPKVMEFGLDMSLLLKWNELLFIFITNEGIITCNMFGISIFFCFMHDNSSSVKFEQNSKLNISINNIIKIHTYIHEIINIGVLSNMQSVTSYIRYGKEFQTFYK